MAVSPEQITEVAKVAAKAASDGMRTSLGELLAWISGFGIFLAGIRKGFMVWQGDRVTNALTEGTLDQIGHQQAQIKDLRYQNGILGLKIQQLRDLEAAGLEDIVTIGVYVKVLRQRKCPCIAESTCCASESTIEMGKAYDNIAKRRVQRKVILELEEHRDPLPALPEIPLPEEPVYVSPPPKPASKKKGTKEASSE